MSTDEFAYIHRAANAALTEFDQRFERAKYHLDQNEFEEALDYFLSALNFFSIYAKKTSEHPSRAVLGKYPPKDAPVYSETLLITADILVGILLCSNDDLVKGFILAKIESILNLLARYESYFDVDKLKQFRNLTSLFQENSSLIETNQDKIEEISSMNPKKIENETLSRIVQGYNAVSNCRIWPGGSSGPCFIATAAYSTLEHPDLDTFREFRDRTLLTNQWGQVAVRFYYRVGPYLATIVKTVPGLQKLTRQVLQHFAQKLRNLASAR